MQKIVSLGKLDILQGQSGNRTDHARWLDLFSLHGSTMLSFHRVHKLYSVAWTYHVEHVHNALCMQAKLYVGKHAFTPQHMYLCTLLCLLRWAHSSNARLSVRSSLPKNMASIIYPSFWVLCLLHYPSIDTPLIGSILHVCRCISLLPLCPIARLLRLLVPLSTQGWRMGWVLGGSCAHAFLGFIFVRLLVVCLGEKEGGSASVCVCECECRCVHVYEPVCALYCILTAYFCIWILVWKWLEIECMHPIRRKVYLLKKLC